MLDMEKLESVGNDILAGLVFEVGNALRGNTNKLNEGVFAVVYAAYICKESEIDSEKALDEYLQSMEDQPKKEFLAAYLKAQYSLVLSIARKYDTETLLAYLYKLPGWESGRVDEPQLCTPESINKLAIRLLEIQDSDHVADLGCGIGGFLLAAHETVPNASYYGDDINSSAEAVVSIRAELFLQDSKIERGDMFELGKDVKFNKIFSNYPWGMSGIDPDRYPKFFDSFAKKNLEFRKNISTDWLFNLLILDHLEEEGRAVAIMTNGSARNGGDSEVRRYFVENHLVSCLISLPPRMFNYLNAPITMIILGHHEGKIHMVDASRLYTAGRRVNEFSDQDIENILAAVNGETEYSRDVSVDALRENDYILTPARYLEKKIEIKDGQEFGSVITRITRGAPFKAKDLDKMASQTPTNIQYLTLSNIQNGMVCDDLPYLKEIDPKYSKYRVHRGDLILSKNGNPFKVAVADFDDTVEVIGSGNLYIIGLDETKINPYYLKAFFESEKGALTLQRIAVGGLLPNITVENLKKAIVPVPPLEEQKKIADLYRTKEDDIKVLQQKLNKAQAELANIFTEK